jgi:hypothetical protein
MKTMFLVETATWQITANMALYGPKPSKYIKIRSNYHRMMLQDASYAFSTNIPACSTTKLNLLTRIKGSAMFVEMTFDGE